MNKKNLVLAVSFALAVILMNTVSMGNIDAQKLKDPDDRFGIVTIDNIKGKSFEVTANIGDQLEEMDKKINGSPEPIDKTSTQVRHTFKWDNDDFTPPGIIRGTAWTACIEYKNGKGGPSCFTDSFNSDTQPDRITLDADYIRDD